MANLGDVENLPRDWRAFLELQSRQDYFASIMKHLEQDHAAGITVYPSEKVRLRVFQFMEASEVKVVILGQDPYHGEGQAMGLSFSVPEGIRIPPSLKNIFAEIKDDIGKQMPTHGDLTGWAEQGVFLLNSALSVRAGSAGSHSKIGWHQFTDSVIEHISQVNDGAVFLLWGQHAAKKKILINEDKHLVLESVHPSPLSAYRGFLGCKHFSKTNHWLKQKNKKPIDW